MDTYQSTLLRLTADWSNGGVNASDALAAADVTDLVAFQSSDSNVVQVSEALAKVRCSQQGIMLLTCVHSRKQLHCVCAYLSGVCCVRCELALRSS
jgi:hypothetical protein